MSKWARAHFGDFAKEVSRPVSLHPGIGYRSVGVKWYGEGVHVHETRDGINFNAERFEIRADDLIYNDMWARQGSVAIVPSDLSGAVASSHFPTFELNRDLVEPRYLSWYFKTPSFWDDCEEASRGSTGRNQIKRRTFFAIPIPLPPLPEQRRIVARIEALAAKIEESSSLRAQTIEEVEGLVRARAREILATITEPRTELRGWLDSSREGIQTGPFGAQLSSHEFQESGVPVLTIGNIQYGGLEVVGLKHVSEEKAQQLDRYAIREGDILFARMGTVGRCCVVPKKAEGWLINYHVIRVALDRHRVDPRFIHWTIRCSDDVERYLEDKIRGATREGVNSGIVGSLPCRIPSLPEQHRIVAYLDGLQAKVDVLKKLQAETANELAALLPSILDKAFKGEL